MVGAYKNTGCNAMNFIDSLPEMIVSVPDGEEEIYRLYIAGPTPF